MSTYVTVVKWARSTSVDEMKLLLAYIDTQTTGNGLETSYNGQFARSWVDESAANDFATFAMSLQKDTNFPTTVTIIKLD